MFGVSIKVSSHGVAEAIGRDIDKLEQELAYRIVDEARTLIDSSTPSGRLYRRGSFTRRNRIDGRRVQGRGTRIHRASAPGQPPAEDTGRTYRDMKVTRLSIGRYRIRFGGVAGYLEFGTKNMKPRPFIVKGIEKAVQKVFG